MTIPATSAIAVGFAHTAGAPDVSLTFSAGTSPVTSTVAARTYRMWVAPAAECFLRVLAASLAADLTTQRAAAYTCIASLSAAGIFTLRIISAAGLPTAVTFASGVWQRLGFASATPSLTSGSGIVDIIGTRPVWHLGLITTFEHDEPQPHQAGGSEQTTGGRVYTIAASATSYTIPCAAKFQPSTPTYRAALGCEATAMYPEGAYLGALGSLATAREHSILDLLQLARNAPCAVALDTWQTLRTSTAVEYYLADLAGLLAPKVKTRDRRWPAYVEWSITLVLPTTAQVGTRV